MVGIFTAGTSRVVESFETNQETTGDVITLRLREFEEALKPLSDKG